MRVKAIIVGAAATAGVAGIAFGGTAVSTAFSADSNASLTAHGAKLNVTTSKNLNIEGLEPGGTASDTFTVTNENTGSTATDLVLTKVGFQAGGWGSNNQPPTAGSLKV